MNLNQLVKYLTPGPWALVEAEDRLRVEGSVPPDTPLSALVCRLGEANGRANGRLIAAAPELLAALYLALQAMQHPALKQAAMKRGQAVIAKLTKQDRVLPDPELRAMLSQAGIIEPALSELALTAMPEMVMGWIRYAQAHDLGPGFVITQLRSGQHPPHQDEKTWYTEEERELILVR